MRKTTQVACNYSSFVDRYFNNAALTAPARLGDGDTHVVASEPVKLPQSLAAFSLKQDLGRQAVLCVLSIVVSVLLTLPLEFQRRIINEIVAGSAIATIIILVGLYFGVGLVEGLVKLGLNVYRGWVSENAVRRLRLAVQGISSTRSRDGVSESNRGTRIAMMLAESEAVGGFMGEIVSQPLMQSATFLSIFAYMMYFQPSIAILGMAVFGSQMLFVPIIQNAINRRIEARVHRLRALGETFVWALPAKSDLHAAQNFEIDNIFSLNMGIFKLKSSMNFLMNLMHHAGAAAVLGYGSWLVVNGAADMGVVIAFMSGLNKLVDPWNDLIDWYRGMTMTRARYLLLTKAIGSS